MKQRNRRLEETVDRALRRGVFAVLSEARRAKRHALCESADEEGGAVLSMAQEGANCVKEAIDEDRGESLSLALFSG